MLQVEYIGEEPVPRDIVDAANKKVEQARAKVSPHFSGTSKARTGVFQNVYSTA